MIQGLRSPKATRLARSILCLVDDRWLEGGGCSLNGEMPSPFLRRFLVVKILWMAGLTINPEDHPDGTSLGFAVGLHTNRFDAVSNFLLNKLEIAGEGHFASALERFWRRPDCRQLGEMLNMLCMQPFPNSFIVL